MPSRTPSETIWTFFDALNTRDLETAIDLIDPSYRGRDVTRSSLTVGRETARKEIRAGMKAFSDLTFSIHHSVVHSPHVAVRWRMEGVHDGSFLQIPATHRTVSVTGMTFFRVHDGQIVRAVHLWDLSGFLRRCGLLPDLPGEPLPNSPSANDDTSE